MASNIRNCPIIHPILELLQEALVSVLGCALFLLVSILTYTSYSHPTYGAPAGKLLSGLCGAVAVMLAINTIVLGLTLRK